jgi:8-oxo-(d)GTP phosphatase
VIRAAGGVVVRVPTGTECSDARLWDQPDAYEVLVVHRVEHDDWSLPKGHLDPGEDDAEAALRETYEETGVHATILAPLPATEHVTPRGRKTVTWFLMTPLDGDPRLRDADGEVDVARFVPAGELRELLTYSSDIELALLAVRTAAAHRQGS